MKWEQSNVNWGAYSKNLGDERVSNDRYAETRIQDLIGDVKPSTMIKVKKINVRSLLACDMFSVLPS